MPYTIKKTDNSFKVCKADNSKCFSKKGITLEKAQKQLKAIGISESKKTLKTIPRKLFLTIAKKVADARGYDSNLLKLSKDGKHKLEYNKIKFGAKNYNDFINYMYNYYLKKISYEEAVSKMKNYRKRAKTVMQKSDKFSPSALSYHILW